MSHEPKRFKEGVVVVPIDSGPNPDCADPSLNVEGHIYTYQDKIKAYIQASIREVVTNTQTQTLTNKTIVAACNTITTAACGNLAATELNSALAELQTDIDTRATSTSLTCHICATSAHGTTGSVVGTSDTQTLTNKTIGDTNTINAQDDAFEVQDSVDNTIAINFNAAGTTGTKTTIVSSQTTNKSITLPDATDTLVGKATTDTLTNKTIVAANNTITTAACGNLVATELNAALAELQADIDTRLSGCCLTAHICDTTTHGTTGCIVGTSDTQTLTNKTLSGNIIATVKPDACTTLTMPVATDTLVGKATTDVLTNKTLTNPQMCAAVVFCQLACTPASPACGDLKLYAKNDGLMYILDSCGTETPVGSGSGGSLDYFYSESFERTFAACLQTTGTITVACSGVCCAISACNSIKVTVGACSACSVIKSPTCAIILDMNEKGVTVGVQGRYKYSGNASDFDFVVYCITGCTTTELTRVSLPATTTPRTVRALANTGSCASQLVWAFEVVSVNACSVLIFDNIEAKINPLPTVESIETLNVSGAGNGAGATTSLVTNIDFTEVSDNLGAFDGTTLTAPFSGYYKLDGGIKHATAVGGVSVYVYIDGAQGVEIGYDADVQIIHRFSGTVYLNKGEQLTLRDNNGSALSNDTSRHTISITAQATSANVVFEGATSDFEEKSYTSTISGWTISSQNLLYRKTFGDRIGIDGLFTVSGAAASLAYMTTPSGFTTKTMGTTSADRRIVGTYTRNLTTNTHGGWIIAGGDLDGDKLYFSSSGVFGSDNINSMSLSNANAIQSSGDILVNILLPVNELKASDLIYSVPVTNEVENDHSGRFDGSAAASVSIVSQGGANIFGGVSQVSLGIFDVTYRAGLGLTQVPVLVPNVSSLSRRISVYNETTSGFRVAIDDRTGTYENLDFSVSAQFQGADYKAPKGYFLGNMAVVNHVVGGTEYETNEKYNNKIVYAVTYDQSLASCTVLATCATKLLSTQGTYQFSATQQFSLPHNDSTTYFFTSFNPSTGEITWVSTSTVQTNVTIKYIK